MLGMTRHIDFQQTCMNKLTENKNWNYNADQSF